MPRRDGAGGIPCGCSESHDGCVNHLHIPWNHRCLGLRRCSPKVGIVWSRSVHRGQIRIGCMVASCPVVLGHVPSRSWAQFDGTVNTLSGSIQWGVCVGTIYIDLGLNINIYCVCVYIYTHTHICYSSP
jgi:hypothetical protein